MDKKNLRKQMLSQRNSMRDTECLKKSRHAAKHLFETASYKQAQNILVYMHYGSELQTANIIRQAFKDHKRVFVPRVEGKNMDFYEIHSMADCEEGFHGIPEPKKDCLKLIFDAINSDSESNGTKDSGTRDNNIKDNETDNAETDTNEISGVFAKKNHTLMILPGLAFDQKGHRLGYGGGYYDRYFERFGTDYIKVAVGYDFQLIDEVPYEAHDIPIDIFISDSRCIMIDNTSGGKL